MKRTDRKQKRQPRTTTHRDSTQLNLSPEADSGLRAQDSLSSAFVSEARRDEARRGETHGTRRMEVSEFESRWRLRPTCLGTCAKGYGLRSAGISFLGAGGRAGRGGGFTLGWRETYCAILYSPGGLISYSREQKKKENTIHPYSASNVIPNSAPIPGGVFLYIYTSVTGLVAVSLVDGMRLMGAYM